MLWKSPDGKWQERKVQIPLREEPPEGPPVNTVTPRLLRFVLTEYFDLDDLTLLCEDLGVDFENLPGDRRDTKALWLVKYVRKHNRLPALENELRRLRPDLDEWKGGRRS